VTPANRARMREVIGRAVRTGLFPGATGADHVSPGSGSGGGHASGHGDPPGTNDTGVDTLPAAAIPGTASAAAPAAGLPPRARFRAALESLAGVVHEARSVDQVADVVAALAAKLGTRSLLAWSEEAMAVPGLTAALEARGLTMVDPEVPQAGASRASQLATLAALPLGVTGADAGLAITGSIVLATGPGRSRMASLLVPVHVAVLRVERLVDSIATLLATRPDLVTAGSNLVAITGPSRTADIEHTLSRGVHGPGEVHVILFEG
jgi:L-lactate dehydrogenase complex protein LldG